MHQSSSPPLHRGSHAGCQAPMSCTLPAPQAAPPLPARKRARAHASACERIQTRATPCARPGSTRSGAQLRDTHRCMHAPQQRQGQHPGLLRGPHTHPHTHTHTHTNTPARAHPSPSLPCMQHPSRSRPLRLPGWWAGGWMGSPTTYTRGTLEGRGVQPHRPPASRGQR